jgi:hypothetical protein
MSENDAERNPAAAVDGIAAEQTEAADELSSLRQQLAEAQAAAVQGREPRRDSPVLVSARRPGPARHQETVRHVDARRGMDGAAAADAAGRL